MILKKNLNFKGIKIFFCTKKEVQPTETESRMAGAGDYRKQGDTGQLQAD